MKSLEKKIILGADGKTMVKEHLCNDFIPKNIVDEFYSSKNFYERKLEMLLSNMF